MPASSKVERKKYAVIADAVGVAHFVVANLTVIIGQTTDLLDAVNGGQYPGLEFVYQTFAAPIFPIFASFVNAVRGDAIFSLVIGEFVIILASVVYGVFAYLFLKLAFAVFE